MASSSVVERLSLPSAVLAELSDSIQNLSSSFSAEDFGTAVENRISELAQTVPDVAAFAGRHLALLHAADGMAALVLGHCLVLVFQGVPRLLPAPSLLENESVIPITSSSSSTASSSRSSISPGATLAPDCRFASAVSKHVRNRVFERAVEYSLAQIAQFQSSSSMVIAVGLGAGGLVAEYVSARLGIPCETFECGGPECLTPFAGHSSGISHVLSTTNSMSAASTRSMQSPTRDGPIQQRQTAVRCHPVRSANDDDDAPIIAQYRSMYASTSPTAGTVPRPPRLIGSEPRAQLIWPGLIVPAAGDFPRLFDTTISPGSLPSPSSSSSSPQDPSACSFGDLAVALLLARANRYPQFTLDPWEPTNPSGPWNRSVFFPEAIPDSGGVRIRDTPFGFTMFEADYLLKQLGLGVEYPVTRCTERPPDGPLPLRALPASLLELGYRDHFTRGSQEMGDEERRQSWRLWIVPDDYQVVSSSVDEATATSSSVTATSSSTTVQKSSALSTSSRQMTAMASNASSMPAPQRMRSPPSVNPAFETADASTNHEFALRVKSVAMRVRVMSLKTNPGSGTLVDDFDPELQSPQSSAAGFVRWFTDHFDEFLPHFPALKRLKTLLLLFHLARWIVALNAPLDTDSLIAAVNQYSAAARLTVPDRVAALSRTEITTSTTQRPTDRATVTTTRTYHMHGGVSFVPTAVTDGSRGGDTKRSTRTARVRGDSALVRELQASDLLIRPSGDVRRPTSTRLPSHQAASLAGCRIPFLRRQSCETCRGWVSFEPRFRNNSTDAVPASVSCIVHHRELCWGCLSPIVVDPKTGAWSGQYHSRSITIPGSDRSMAIHYHPDCMRCDSCRRPIGSDRMYESPDSPLVVFHERCKQPDIQAERRAVKSLIKPVGLIDSLASEIPKMGRRFGSISPVQPPRRIPPSMTSHKGGGSQAPIRRL